MSDIRLRSGQLIVPFGVGQIVPNKEGLSMMIGGLNLWDKIIQKRKDEGLQYNPQEIELHDERLQRLLGVDKFLRPFPFYKRSKENNALKLPAVVFPRWHYCSYCKVMRKSELTGVDEFCIESKCENKYHKMIPVRFVAACDKGHIQDVPFVEWAHKNGEVCSEPKLRYAPRGGSGSLSDIYIECTNTKCGESASLHGLLNVKRDEENGIIITSALNSTLDIKCEGKRPWIGQEGMTSTKPCENHLQVIVSGGSNVHYANVSSALVLPIINKEEELNKLLNPYNVQNIEKIYYSQGDEIIIDLLGDIGSVQQGRISSRDLFEKVKQHIKSEEDNGEYDEIDIRFEEFQFFKNDNNFRDFKSHKQDVLDTVDDVFDGLIRSVVLVEKLKEIRVFTGFTRLNSRNMSTREKMKNFLSNQKPTWLPAYEHYGEGIFIEFNLDSLDKSNNKYGIHPRIKNYRDAQLKRYPQNYKARDIDNSFITIHTLAHILIRRLCFNSGYGSSSLRERIYYSTKENTKMAGLLIYTASGDSEGSLGGLVNQGEISNFKRLFKEALIDAQWCSSDPVCSDIGKDIGQGPNNVNGAACHNCCIVPETSCEEFNSLLDRNILLKFFSNILE